MDPSSCRVHRAEIAAVFVVAVIVGVSSGGCAARTPHVSRASAIAHQAKTAAVPPGSWRRVEALRPASPLVVTVRNGERREGAFKSLSSATLTLTTSSGGEFSVPKREVDTVVAKAKKGVGNGAAIGAGVGFVAGLAVLAIAGSGDGSIRPTNDEARMALTGVGSRVGGLVDGQDKRDRLIYVAAR